MEAGEMPEPAHVLTVAREAARQVAAYHRAVTRTEVAREHKLDQHDIVTQHDRRSEEIATAALREAFPDCRIVGEEFGVQPGEGEGEGLTFFIDPIDGTSNFVAGMPLFSVSIGAAIGGELVAGVVNAAQLGHEFYAARGHGAWVESFDTDGPVRLGAPAERGHEQCVVLTGFPNARDIRRWGPAGEDAARELQLNVMAVRNIGSTTLELAFVAAGWVDGCLGATAGPWDLAAGFALVQEAGGRLSHAPLLSEAPAQAIWDNPGYAASGPGRELEILHATLAELEDLAVGMRP
ncbi:MAG: inositol monophosphatase family protein [bacterium]|nr:inositol monophosphatase family protein [bacterium]